MKIKKKVPACPRELQPHKSLKNRITFMVNLSIGMSVFLVCLILILFTDFGIHEFADGKTEIIIEEVQGLFVDLSIEAETVDLGNVTDDDLINIFNSEQSYRNRIQRETDRVPIFSTTIYISDKVIYNVDAEKIISEMLLGISIKDEEELEAHFNETFEDEEIDFSGDLTESILYDHKGNEIGRIEIGLDSRIQMFIYVALTILVTVTGLLVLFLMRFITNLFVRPILKPLEKLQTQLDQLADESYEDINPTIIVDKRTVREVKALSNATNKLLNKMVNYNEVITQSEKMASVGQLTAAITHEINTPLGVINANAGLMKMLAEEAVNTDEVDEKQMLLETMGETADTTEEACSRIQEIIKSLRSYSRIDQADFMPASINESMKSVVTLTTNLHKNRIQIIEDFGDIPDVSCYIGLVNQVFMNLIINAIQAIEGEGTITLKTTSDDEYVYASVIDSGCGISNKNIYRVFEYGFTTKQPGSGSGIGLALSKNIVQKHNGEIIVDSEEGKGATITIRLPIGQ